MLPENNPEPVDKTELREAIYLAETVLLWAEGIIKKIEKDKGWM